MLGVIKQLPDKGIFWKIGGLSSYKLVNSRILFLNQEIRDIGCGVHVRRKQKAQYIGSVWAQAGEFMGV
jgi:hypothetical protein